MDLLQAIATVEYKIATESDNFAAGRIIKMDINSAWPPETILSDALRRKYPYISVTYDRQAHDQIQLLIINKKKQVY